MIPNTTRSPLLKKSDLIINCETEGNEEKSALFLFKEYIRTTLSEVRHIPNKNKKKKGITRYEDCSTWVVACSSAIAQSCHNNKQREPISTILSRQQLRSQHCARAERDNVLYIVFSTILHYATQLDLFFSTNTFHFILIYRVLLF